MHVYTHSVAMHPVTASDTIAPLGLLAIEAAPALLPTPRPGRSQLRLLTFALNAYQKQATTLTSSTHARTLTMKTGAILTTLALGGAAGVNAGVHRCVIGRDGAGWPHTVPVSSRLSD